jgi:hypothetical protein
MDYNKENSGTIWIVKPGENSNRGCGITICENVNELNKEI